MYSAVFLVNGSTLLSFELGGKRLGESMMYKVCEAWSWNSILKVQRFGNVFQRRLLDVLLLSLVSLGFAQEFMVAQEAPPRQREEKVQEVQLKLPDFVSYKKIERIEPRSLQIHVLTIHDVKKARFEVVAGDDPDGEGEVEATLSSPRTLAESVGAIAAINTAAWSMFPDPVTGKKTGYVLGGRADIQGWILTSVKQVSPPQAGYWSVLLDRSGRAKIEEIGTLSVARDLGLDPQWVISGFRGILKEGRVLVEVSDVRHPRTAIGLNGDGTSMTWVVVDGRQKGYSEGVSEEELAKLLLEQGCTEGINLDGGGSSSMWIRDQREALRLMNRPSDPTGARPVPVILTLVPQ